MNESDDKIVPGYDWIEGRQGGKGNGNTQRDSKTGRYHSVGEPFNSKAYFARRYQENREKIHADCAKKYAENPEPQKLKSREYRRTHKKEIAAYRKRYRNANLEKLKAIDREYHAINRDRKNSRAQIYGKIYRTTQARRISQHRYNNSDKGRKAMRRWHNINDNLPKQRAIRISIDAKRRLLETGTMLSCAEIAIRKITTSKIQKCFYCGKRIPLGKLHIDHVNPLARGGVHAAYNLVGACQSCNLHKSKKHSNKFVVGQQLLVF